MPFATQNKTLSQYQAQSAVNAIGTSNLEALELGNEPDFYVSQGNRPSGWGPSDYASEFHSYADWLVGVLGISSSKKFESLTLAAAHPGGIWSA